MPQTPNPALKVVACVIEKDGRFLITKRMKHSHLGHLWEFPGGKIEADESIEDCAIRECMEEIAVRVKPLRLIEEVAHDYPERSVHLYFMLCELESGAPRAVECADWAWVKPEDFDRYEFPAADKGIIASFIQSSMRNGSA